MGLEALQQHGYSRHYLTFQSKVITVAHVPLAVTFIGTPFCPQSVSLRFIRFPELTAIISLKRINLFLFVIETQCFL
jgi:hypothetical protein